MAQGLGSIVGTLAGLDPATLAEALARQEQEQLAARTAQTTQAAQAAGQQYQQASQAPTPELNIFEQLIPALFGNVASVLSQNPVFGERGQQQVEMSRAEMLKARADNLMALRDVWSQKAQAAQRAGDFEEEAKHRMSFEKVSKLYDMVKTNQEYAASLGLEDRRQAGDIAQVQEQGRQARLTQAAAGGIMDRQSRADLVRQGIDPDSPPGEERLLSTWAHREIGRRNQLAKRGDVKSRNQAVNEIREIAYRRWSSDATPLSMGERLLRLRSPFYGPSAKEQRYLLTDEKVFKKVRGEWVKDSKTKLRAEQAADDLVEPYFSGG